MVEVPVHDQNMSKLKTIIHRNNDVTAATLPHHGDRAACSRIDGCAPISVFDGMNGNVRFSFNFSFCCCHTPNCNKALDGELESIYAETRRKKDVTASSSSR
ncbi:hypothetical protein OSTOST_06658, partial [Ostertagia ostertagi]